ncbi:MAG: serine hydrolase [Cyclobacteriaceae bacterium]
MQSTFDKKSIYTYFILTFSISWFLWSPFYFSEKVSEFWVLPGAWGPTISAIALTFFKQGKKGVRELFGKLLIWKVPFPYYLFSVVGILFIGFISISIYMAFGGDAPDSKVVLEGMGLPEDSIVLAIALSPIFFLINTLFGGPIAEELGWRGYAQEALQQKYSPNLSGLIIGFLWSLWHLPLFIFLPKAVGNMSLYAYIPLMTAMGLVFSWLYNRTKGSVLLAILLHGGMNFTHGFLGADILSDRGLLIIQVVLIIALATILSQSNRKWVVKNNVMKKSISILLLFVSYQVATAQDYPKAIEKARFLIQHHQQQTQIPGVQVALIVRDSLIWSESFGYSNLEKRTPVEKTTKFRIASISKSLTSIALGEMIEQEQIDIDKDIRFYLPEFPEKEYPITARQLASSTAGIRHYNSDEPKYNSVNYPDIQSSLMRFQDDPLLFEPATDYHYSSYGWVLLSAVMEKASGKPFSQLMAETWEELGMAHTTFDYPDKKTENVSRFYIHSKKQGRVLAPDDNRSYMYAGGGYLSTAEDLAKMASRLLKNQYLEDSTLQELFSSQTLKDGTKTHYGLGWETGVSRVGSPIVFHSGSLSSARSHLVIYPDEEIVFAYLANTGDQVFFNDREAQNIAEIFVKENRIKEEPKGESDLIGEWKISTTSLRSKKTKGTLRFQKNEQGIIAGELEFKRSRKQKSFPIVLTEFSDNQAHLVAVSPMYIDFFLTINGNSFQGEWLHDFNVKGVPEKDDYWKPRAIVGERKSNE